MGHDGREWFSTSGLQSMRFPRGFRILAVSNLSYLFRDLPRHSSRAVTIARRWLSRESSERRRRDYFGAFDFRAPISEISKETYADLFSIGKYGAKIICIETRCIMELGANFEMRTCGAQTEPTSVLRAHTLRGKNPNFRIGCQLRF